jgi:hypothetical protein
MLFPARFYDGLRDGTITLTFRRWKRPQAKVGGRHGTPVGDLVVDAVDVARASTVTDADARRAGFADADALRREFKWSPDDDVYRIEFHREDSAPRRSPPSLDDDAMSARLDRLDAASAVGPWTRPTLRLIAAKPGVRAGDLAAELGRERLPFKADVRKLKRLGLTESLEIGYRLSERGKAYLDAAAR